MRYNKRSSSACDWPFHFTPLFYQNRPPPSCHPKLYSSECQCHTLCFAAPKVFLTSCNFDDKNKKKRLENKLTSASWCRPNFFLWISESSALHLIQSRCRCSANQCRPNEQGFNEERMSIKRGSLQLLIHHIFSCINCAGRQPQCFLHWEEGIKFSEKKSSLYSLYPTREPSLLDAISIIWPYSCRERVENDERKFSPNMSH